VEDVASESERRIVSLSPREADDIRFAKAPVIAFSEAMAPAELELKKFLFSHMYRHERVVIQRETAIRTVRDLFDAYHQRPAEMGEAGSGVERGRLARRVADYIAGMTDRFALQEHARLFDAGATLG